MTYSVIQMFLMQLPNLNGLISTRAGSTNDIGLSFFFSILVSTYNTFVGFALANRIFGTNVEQLVRSTHILWTLLQSSLLKLNIWNISHFFDFDFSIFFFETPSFWYSEFFRPSPLVSCDDVDFWASCIDINNILCRCFVCVLYSVNGQVN